MRRTRTYAVTARPISNALPMPVSTMSGTAPVEGAQKTADTRRNIRPKVKVDGARKIWGTLSTCTTRAVSAAISKLVDGTLTLRIKRKSKVLVNNKSVWWFIVHGMKMTWQPWSKDGIKSKPKHFQYFRIAIRHHNMPPSL